MNSAEFIATAVLFFGAGCLLLKSVLKSFHKGVMHGRGGPIYRSNSPLGFWLAAVVMFVCVLGIFLMALLFVGDAWVAWKR